MSHHGQEGDAGSVGVSKPAAAQASCLRGLRLGYGGWRPQCPGSSSPRPSREEVQRCRQGADEGHRSRLGRARRLRTGLRWRRGRPQAEGKGARQARPDTDTGLAAGCCCPADSSSPGPRSVAPATVQSATAEAPALFSRILRRGLLILNDGAAERRVAALRAEIIDVPIQIAFVDAVDANSARWSKRCVRPPFAAQWLEYESSDLLCGALIEETGADAYQIRFVTTPRAGRGTPTAPSSTAEAPCPIRVTTWRARSARR